MVDWRAIGYGMILFPIVLAASLSEEPLLILLSGFPSGLVTGYRSEGLLNGLVYGVVTGSGIFILFFGGCYYLVVESTGPGMAYPGVGMTLVLLFFVAALLAVESVIGGAIGGLLAKL